MIEWVIIMSDQMFWPTSGEYDQSRVQRIFSIVHVDFFDYVVVQVFQLTIAVVEHGEHLSYTVAWHFIAVQIVDLLVLLVYPQVTQRVYWIGQDIYLITYIQITKDFCVNKFEINKTIQTTGKPKKCQKGT